MDRNKATLKFKFRIKECVSNEFLVEIKTIIGPYTSGWVTMKTLTGIATARAQMYNYIKALSSIGTGKAE